MEGISTSKRRVLEGLLDQKQKKVHELNLAEQSYLKRKINQEAYIKIIGDIKKEMVSVDAQIISIQKAGEIEKLKDQLKKGAKEIHTQQKNTQNRGLNEELEEEVLDQLHLR